MNYCLSCFGKPTSPDNERDPLLPRHRTTGNNRAIVEQRTGVDKIVDTLAALNAGKLPTQEQLNHFLQIVQKSELLKDAGGKLVQGYGPMSKQGRKTIGDVRALVQALLRFGMEKNADDKIQDLYFQISQIDSPPVDVSMNVDIDTPAAYKAGQAAFDKTKEGVSNIKDETPTTDQLVFDATTLLHSLRTVFVTCISSPASRLILVDMISIGRDLVAHAAVDVQRAAGQVQHIAEVVEEKAHDDDVIAKEEGGQLKINTSVDDIKNKGKDTVDRISEGMDEVKSEWKGITEEVSQKTRQKILGRIQQVISRIQKDEASRLAMHAILTLARKYADKIASVSEVASDTITEVAQAAKETINGDADKHQPPEPTTYPPKPHGGRKDGKPLLDISSDALLLEVKDVLQRLGQNRSLDGLLSALSRVVKDINHVPIIVKDEVNKVIDEKAHTDHDTDENSPLSASNSTEPPGFQSQPGKGRGKGKKNKKGRKKEKAGGQIEPSTSLSESQGPYSPTEEKDQSGNSIQEYFSQFGQYLDRSLDEPGWAISKEGGKTLESLFDEGVELLNIVSESVVHVGEEAISEDKDTMRTPTSASPEKFDDEIRREFSRDLKSFMDEAGAYISAVENDRTTMRVVRAIEQVGDDLSALFFQGARKSPRGAAASFARNVTGIGGWTDWIGWILPRLLRMLPDSALPVPSIEMKTGSVEAGLYALFIQGFARGREHVEPAKTSLVPDEVVLKEWTEVRVDMADQQDGGEYSNTSTSSSGPRVQTSSRIHMHVDGVRAKVEEMGYYFKYAGSVVGYEDEGLLSIDIGMGSAHHGLGADVELEIESDSVSHARQIPRIIVEGEVDLVEDEVNLGEVQTDMVSVDLPFDPLHVEPLFKVIDVRVAMRGLHFRIDKSRHWILNKLVLQPLAGPVVAKFVKQAVEEKMKSGLEVLAKGLGVVLQDAKIKGESRRALRRKRRAHVVEAWKGFYSEQAGEDDDENDSLGDILSDWYAALLQNGPALLGYDAKAQDPATVIDTITEEEADVETTANLQATLKGVVYTSKTTTTVPSNGYGATAQQPPPQPPMVFKKSSGSMEEAQLPSEVDDLLSDSSEEVEEEEMVVAIGGGAQLFPGKGGPYGEASHGEGTVESQGLLSAVEDGATKATNGVKMAADTARESAREGVDVVVRAEERFGRKKAEQRESTRTWRSDAFDSEF